MTDFLAGFQAYIGLAFVLWLDDVTGFLLYAASLSIWFFKRLFSLTDMMFFAAMYILAGIPLLWYGNSRSYSYRVLTVAAFLFVAVVAALRKNSFVGLPFHFLGVFSNALVLIVNGLKMPSSLEIVDGMVLSETHIFMSAATSLNYLGDWISFPGSRFVGLFSPGDLLMAFGTSVAFIEALLKKRGV